MRNKILLGGRNYERTAAYLIRDGHDEKEVLAALEELRDVDEMVLNMLEEFQGKFYKTEEGCFIWTGRYSTKSKVPLYGSKNTCVRKTMFERCAGYRPRKLRRLCGTDNCVNPAHQKEVVLKETAITRTIMRNFNKHGKCIKIHGNVYQIAGTPDIIGSIEGQCILIEVKNETGKLRPAQVVQIGQWRGDGEACVIVARSWGDVVNGIKEQLGIEVPV